MERVDGRLGYESNPSARRARSVVGAHQLGTDRDGGDADQREEAIHGPNFPNA
jgi:hypothetical protein